MKLYILKFVKKISILLIAIILFVFINCDSSSEDDNNPNPETLIDREHGWNIPTNQLLGSFNPFQLIEETKFGVAKQILPNAKIALIKNEYDPGIRSTNIDYLSYGIKSGSIKKSVTLYSYDLFSPGSGIIQLNNNMIIVGNKDMQFITSFNTPSKVRLIKDRPFHFQDDNGNIWNFIGMAVEGLLKGERLSSPKGYVAALNAWNSLFDNTKEYE